MDAYPKLDDSILAHHGILGQKWGKRNGPPYPLGAGDHSASEKKAGWKKSLGGGRNEELYDRKQKKQAPAKVDKADTKVQNGTKKGGLKLTKEQKIAIGVGVGIVAAAGVTILAVKTGKIDALAKVGSKLAENASLPGMGGNSGPLKISPEEHFGKIEKTGETWDDSLKVINKYNGKDNCAATSAGILIRENERLNVIAKPIEPQNWKDIEALFNNVREHQKVMPVDSGAELADYLSNKFKDGDNGIIGFNARNSGEHKSHYMSFLKKNGEIRFLDGQTNPNLSFIIRGKTAVITLNGESRIVPAQIIEERILGNYNLDNTEFLQVNDLHLTDNVDLLDKWFERG